MKVQLLYFAGCPNLEAARQALQSALAAAGLPPDYEEVDTNAPETPEALRGWGSPTVLVDGLDVAGQAQPAGSSCRLYPGGRAPSEAMIRDALATARGTHAPPRPLTRATLAGAVLAALAASACCILPAVLALVGVSGVGLADALAPWRPVFLSATAGLLGLGFYLSYRRRKAALACDCPSSRGSRTARGALRGSPACSRWRSRATPTSLARSPAARRPAVRLRSRTPPPSGSGSKA